MSARLELLPVLQVVSYANSTLGLFTMTAFSMLSEPVKSCPEGWERFRGKCYLFGYVPKNSDVASVKFDDARKKCTDAGADLVALNNEQVCLTLNQQQMQSS